MGATNDFKGIKKEDHEKLTRAARTYQNMTGEDVLGVVGQIPVHDPEKDPEEKARRDAEALQAHADATNQLERSQQEARRLRMRTNEQGEVQDENPGPGQPAMVTERAKQQGKSRKGDEPPQARGESVRK